MEKGKEENDKEDIRGKREESWERWRENGEQWKMGIG